MITYTPEEYQMQYKKFRDAGGMFYEDTAYGEGGIHTVRLIWNPIEKKWYQFDANNKEEIHKAFSLVVEIGRKLS